MKEDSNRKALSCVNINSPIIEIAHKELTRTGDSPFRSICPICKKGSLLVGRNQKTFELLEYDNCVLCGQKVRYTDIEDLQNFEHGRVDKLPVGWKDKYGL